MAFMFTMKTVSVYLEGLSGLWCASLGYANEELIDAITQQLRTLPYSQLFGGRTHQRAIDLADELASMVPVDDARIFFANSGSEANDSHVKMLRYYSNVIGKPQKKKIIAFREVLSWRYGCFSIVDRPSRDACAFLTFLRRL